MIRFILNDKLVETEFSSGSTVLDFVRYHKRLTGTKIGCREGDCGACTLLVGDMENGKLVYRSATSCLMPLGNARGKHIVSIEGINMKALSPVQQAMVDCNGTQCGFCTIGFVVSLTGFVLNDGTKNHEDAIAAVDGNICRCTGYKSIERAAGTIVEKMKEKPQQDHLSWLVQAGFIPEYFLHIQERLQVLNNKEQTVNNSNSGPVIGGGTDLLVQRPLSIKRSAPGLLTHTGKINEIKLEKGTCYVGAAVTVSAFAESILIQKIFPDLKRYIKLISSTPIRNMATLGGNLVNASPIGDMSVFFLALDADILLRKDDVERKIKLKDFYKGYKQLDKATDEIIEQIIFTPPAAETFNFEKVSKRTHLDIASVNSGCTLLLDESGKISEIHLSAGGVAPFPLQLAATALFLKGKIPRHHAVLEEAIDIMNNEIAPISDARGTADYKRLLLRQLFLAHFQKIDSKSEPAIKKILLAS